MNENRRRDPRPNGDDDALGDALGEAVGREAGSPVVTPPVADIAERAAARAKARRVRHGVVGIAAAAALIAGGLAAWNTLGGGGGNIQVATRPTVPERSEPATSEPEPATAERAEQPGESEPDGAGNEPAAARPAEPPGDGSSPADPQPTDPPAVDPDGGGAEEPDSSFPTPESLSTGPTLEWTEVSVDLGDGPTDSVELESLGDGRVVARVRSESDDRVAITGDGITWTTVGLPDGTVPYRIAVDRDSWVVASSGSDDPGRVLVSDDGGESWSDLILDLRPEVALPRHCVEQSAVQDVLISGDRVVVLLSFRRLLDLEVLLAERGLIPEGTPAHEWRRSGDVLTVRLGDPAGWSSPDEDDTMTVTLDELGLTPEQLHDCDDYAPGRVRVLVGDGSRVGQVAEYEGGAASAVATRDGFAMVLVTETGVRRLTSGDGRLWAEIPTTEEGHATVARGPDGTVWLGENHRSGYRIRRGDIAGEPRPVAEFDTLEPVGVLSAGPAGVVTSAWLLPDAIRDLIAVSSFEKDGYELRLSNASGDISLWDLAEGAAVYEFSAEQTAPSDELPDGVREVTEGDGSVSLVFSDPATGEELVRFTQEDLVPDTDRLVSAREELFGPTGVPPIWIGWSADGDRWGWQDAAAAFGLAAGEGLTPVALAAGDDFVLARFASFDIAEALAASDEWQPPSSWRFRWFIAPVR